MATIIKMEFYVLEIPMVSPFHSSLFTAKACKSIIVAAHDDAGGQVYGECPILPVPIYSSETEVTSMAALRAMAQGIKGQCSYEEALSVLLGKRDEYLDTPAAFGAMETMLSHGVAFHRGQNTVEYVFGESILPSIAEGVVLGDWTPEELIALGRAAYEQGCRRFKVKVRPERAVAQMEALRINFSDVELVIDANGSFDFQRDREVLMRLDALHLACIEEPFHLLEKDRKALEGVQGAFDTPIAYDESARSVCDVELIGEKNYGAMVVLKTGKMGGLTAVHEVVDACRALDLGYWTSNMLETDVGKVLGAQISALPGTVLVGDFSNNSRYFQEHGTVPGMDFVDGCMDVPRGPGLGVTIDRTWLMRYCQSYGLLYGSKN